MTITHCSGQPAYGAGRPSVKAYRSSERFAAFAGYSVKTDVTAGCSLV